MVMVIVMENQNTWQNEYPRPQMKRDSFINLNGKWQCNGQDIIIPFSPQAKASQFKGPVTDKLVYVKHFSLATELINSEQRILLHFGAVDQICEVFLNKYYVGHHAGGYLPFTFDISLFAKKENTLTVIVFDRLDKQYPYGKQSKESHGMWYQEVSGIWQTVWIESVPQKYIKNIRITPHEKSVELVVEPKMKYKVIIPMGDDIFEKVFTTSQAIIDLSAYDVHLWSVDDPYLYRFYIEAGEDRIESYFALREISVKNKNHHSCLMLNHEPIFIHALLDQGYYPDGYFIPLNPQGYRQDIENMKKLGFNAVRKHVKIEADLYYYYCDCLGMLVIQDMVNSGEYHFIKDTLLPTSGFKSRKDTGPKYSFRHQFFIQHCIDTIQVLYNHPSIIAYTIFNEGWGQFDSDRLYQLFKQCDCSRLYDMTSGWFHQKLSDFESVHMYFVNRALKSGSDKILFLSECGGFISKVKGHYHTHHAYGYSKGQNKQQLIKKIERLYQKTVIPAIKEGLCGCVYTQLSDIENELNGLYTFDRQVCKVPHTKMLKIKTQIEQMIKK